MNNTEIRNTTKNLLRGGAASLQQYEEALPLCKILYESYSETQELWDVHQYANCLKKHNKLDEAEQVCEKTYFDNKNELSQDQIRAFSYIKNLFAWIINDKYIKTVRDPNYKYAAIVLDKLVLLNELLQLNNTNTPSFSFCVLTVLAQLNKTGEFTDNNKFLCILEMLKPELLSSEARKYTDSSGKERELPSQKEDYYKIKSDLLIKNNEYEECILCCNEAMEVLEQFHYNNDVWFSRKIAISLAALGNIEDAINKLEKLIVISDKWFLLYEIGKFYQKIKKPNLALEYMLRAICTKDPEKMKVSLIESIGDVLNEIDDKAFAQENFLYARQVRLDNDWTVSDRLKKKIINEKAVTFKEMRNKWINTLYQLVGSKQGKVSKLFTNNTGGFIQVEKSYYFQMRNFFGRRDLLKIGDVVEFILTVSYDRKHQVETMEATVIRPCKK